MSDDRKRLLERYARSPTTSTPPITESTDVEEYQAAAIAGANRPPEAMLQLRLKHGDVLALSYPLLISAALNPSQGIVLEFTSHRVTLAGRNLGKIFVAIAAHRLAYVQELPSWIDELPENDSVVTSIEIAQT